MELYETISTIRYQLEQHLVPKSLLIHLYNNYQKLDDFDSFIDQAISLFPKLNCGVSSLYVQYVLGKGKIIKGKYKEFDHTFLQIDKKTIIDLTADQYGGPKIYVGPVVSPWSLK